MSRTVGPVCRLCRREGIKLYLKGSRCQTARCSLTKREATPGDHPFARRKPTEYALHMREKQKVQRHYGLRKEGLWRVLRQAQRAKGPTGEVLLQSLERRLDNALYRAGFALSRWHARQIVVHGHVQVNGRKVDRPGFLVSVGDEVRPRASREKSERLVRGALEATKGSERPPWLEVDAQAIVLRVRELPTRQDVPIPVQEQLIVEFASR